MEGGRPQPDAEQRFLQLFRNNPNPMWTYDRETLRILDVNEAAVAMYGYSREEFLQLRLVDIRPAEDVPRMLAKLTELRPGYTETGGFQHVTKHGRHVNVETGTFLSKGQDGRDTCLVVIRDVTERIMAERALRQSQKMEAVGQLTGGLAHDFNNLLSVIIGNLDLLMDRLASDTQATELVDAAVGAAMRGAQLAHRLLAFSRQQALTPRVLDLNELLPDMDRLLRRTLGERIALTAAPADGLWAAMADPSQVENAILNLAINARDAMPDGGRLVVETANVTLDEHYAKANADVRPGEYVMLGVTDTGTGMPPEVVERAFEPFFTTKAVGKGSGLGLSMIYGFAKQSGGHLKIYSEVGHGTSVKLYLPRAMAGGPAEAAPTVVQAKPSLGEIVLIVEDDAEVRKMSSVQLKGLGYRVHEAADAQAAIEILEREKVDLLFSDIVMPGAMTGLALVEEAQRRWPCIRILLTTGYAEAAVRNTPLPGDVALISKPYRRHELANKIRQTLDAEAVPALGA